MATARVLENRVPQGDDAIPKGKTLIDYEDAMERLNDSEKIKASLYAINTLLIEKGFYSAEEYRFQFRQSAQKQLKKRSGQ